MTFAGFGVEKPTGSVADLWPEFQPALFSDSLARISQHLTDYLQQIDGPAIAMDRPSDILAALRRLDDLQSPQDKLDGFIQLMLQTGVHLPSRGYMARQFSSVVPVSAAVDALTAMAPQPASFFEVGPLPNAADKLMLAEFEARLGWPAGKGAMIVTSGGSLANVTALLAARNGALRSSWGAGVATTSAGEGRILVAMGADAHYSLTRAVGVIGLGTDNILRLPLNDRRQICPVQAAGLLDQARARGHRVICLVASAGATATGAIDSLQELAAIAAARGIWFHVDAAHSGAFLVSDELQPRLAGIELADSFCLDAHKTLFVPALCTLLFYRDKAKADTPFQQEASYVFGDAADEMVQFESGARNFECTKRASILNLWLTWSMYGRGLFERKLNHLVATTELAHRLISTAPDFAPLHVPESNILCFQYRPINLSATQMNELQDELHHRLRQDGRFFLSGLTLNGVSALRLVIMNHLIVETDILAMLDHVRSVGCGILTEWNLTQEDAA